MSEAAVTKDHVTFELRDDGVARITLARPEAKNALSVAMRDRLIELVERCQVDPEVRSVLLAAQGEVFCSGMDLRESTVSDAGKPGFDPRSTSVALKSGVHRIILGLWQLDKPTVAAVGGAAVGPGAHLALACDFVITTPVAKFAWSFSRWGLVVDAGGAYLLPRLVGMSRAKEMVLLGVGSSGEEAVEEGLALRCVQPEELAHAAEGLAVELAAGPTRAIGLSKRLLNASFETTLVVSLDQEADAQALATASHDLVEGMAAFRERRDPVFEGR